MGIRIRQAPSGKLIEGSVTGQILSWNNPTREWDVAAAPGPGGSITPVANTLVLNQSPTGPSGPPTGAYTSDLAFVLVSECITAAANKMLLLAPGDYTEPQVDYADQSVWFVGQTARRDNTILPDLGISSTGGSYEVTFQNLIVNVIPDFTLGDLTVLARNARVDLSDGVNITVECYDSHVSASNFDTGSIVGYNSIFENVGSVTPAQTIELYGGSVESGSIEAVGTVIVQNARIAGSITGAGIDILNCSFLNPVVFTGSVTIDLHSYLLGVAAGCTFPVTTTVTPVPSLTGTGNLPFPAPVAPGATGNTNTTTYALAQKFVPGSGFSFIVTALVIAAAAGTYEGTVELEVSEDDGGTFNVPSFGGKAFQFTTGIAALDKTEVVINCTLPWTVAPTNDNLRWRVKVTNDAGSSDDVDCEVVIQVNVGPNIII